MFPRLPRRKLFGVTLKNVQNFAISPEIHFSTEIIHRLHQLYPAGGP